MSLRLAILLSLAWVAMAASRLPGQTLQRDPVSGDFILEFTDIDGVHHRLVIEPRDKISPRMSVAIESSGAAYVYRYVLTNESGPNTKQPIGVVLLPCPGGDPSLSVEPAPGWNAFARRTARQPECEFSHREAWLEPGQSVGDFIVRSAWLPAPAGAWVFGRARIASLPVSAEDVPDTVIYILQNIQGIDFNSISGREVHTLVPARSPATLDDPAAALSVIRSDLDQACGELAWITDAGVCRSLGEKLDAASEALTRFWAPKWRARRHLEAFLRELEAYHGGQRGKPVDDNAYALLKINTEYVLSRL